MNVKWNSVVQRRFLGVGLLERAVLMDETMMATPLSAASDRRSFVYPTLKYPTSTQRHYPLHSAFRIPHSAFIGLPS